jgi:hypothetical protein
MLLVTWGRISWATFDTSGIQSFAGTDLRGALPIMLLAAAGVSALVAGVALIRPLRYPLLLLIGGLASLGALVLVVIESQRRSIPFVGLVDLNQTTHRSWHWLTGTMVLVIALTAVSAVVWMMLSVLSWSRPCPDCAERVSRSAINCPHCGYEFRLPAGQKRCPDCRQPVKAQARVCRHCGSRFDESERSAPV